MKIDKLLIFNNPIEAYYLSGFYSRVFLIFDLKSKINYLFETPLELERAREMCNKRTKVINLYSMDFQKYKNSYEAIAKIIKNFLKRNEVLGIYENLPYKLVEELKKEKVKFRIVPKILNNLRRVKSRKEIEMIKEVTRINEYLMKKAIEIIKKRKTTVGKIKSKIISLAFEYDLEFPEDLIISVGEKTSQPHYTGNSEDIIKENEPIILDFYPRSKKTNYYSDITRTVVKGVADDEIKRMYQVVLEAQEKAIKSLKPGILAKEIHDIVCDVIESAGYPTLRKNPKTEIGFIHATGHGVGLEVHDADLRIPSNEVIEAGYVITIEPGIYIPKKGGVRLEDLVLITKNGFKNLTKIPKYLNIDKY